MPKPRFVVQDTLWALELLKRKLEKVFILPRMSISSQTADLHDEISIEKDVPTPMRDGIRLYADIYRPKAEGSYPVILTRMPYGKSEYYCYIPAVGKFWARKGYAYVAQDVRGKWRSEGEWDPFVNEIDDGYDTLDWVAGQPWCDGNIGMMGESYYGYTTWAAATTGHPNLKCVSPSTTAMDIHGVWIYNNGAFCLQTMGTWGIEMNAKEYRNPLRLNYKHLPLASIDTEAEFPCGYYQDWLKHSAQDSYWEGINLNQKYDQIKIPVLHFGGWYDAFLKATIDNWIGVREKNSTGENQWLVVGPWDHNYSTDETGRIGQLDVGDNSQTTYWNLCESFFDFWLRGADNNFDQTPKVQLFTMGTNQWHKGNEWPPAGSTTHDYYLHSQGNAHLAESDGTLDLAAPTSDEPQDSYTYDPSNPVAMTLDLDFWDIARCLRDRSQLPKREDVLVYDTPPLTEDLEITGPISITLYATSSALDTDFTATLVDIFPNGYAHLIQEGIIRTSFRHPDRDPSPIEPGRVYGYNIDLWATSYVIKAGHRMRVEISSSNFNRFDPNPNTGEPFGTATDPITAQQQIFHSAKYPSRITILTNQDR
jgi:putative CocE/NonD family hydrolase